MTALKRWRDGLLIPDQHEPGLQRGFRGSAKVKKFMGSEHQSRKNNVIFWPVGRWAGGEIGKERKKS